MKKVFCKNKHRMVFVVPDLALCECSDYGRLSWRKGAVEEARALVARAGGLEAIRDKVEAQEVEKRQKRVSRPVA